MSATPTPKPFCIDGPGLYVTREMGVVTVGVSQINAAYPWAVYQDGEKIITVDHYGRRWTGGEENRYDIIAKSPTPKPTKAKKARRRYVVDPDMHNPKCFAVVRRAEFGPRVMATGMSRAVARRVAAMLCGGGA